MKIHTVASYSTKNQDIEKPLPRIHLYFNSNHHTDKKQIMYWKVQYSSETGSVMIMLGYRLLLFPLSLSILGFGILNI